MNLDTAVDSPKGDAPAKMDLDAAIRAAVSSTMKSDTPAAAPAREATEEPKASADHDGSGEPSPDAGKDGAKAPDKSAAPSGSDTAQAADEATLEAPKVWPKEQRDAFSSLPDEAKKLLLAREKTHNSHFSKNAQDNATHRRFADEVRSLFEPGVREKLHAQGLTEIQALRQMINLQDTLARDPVAGIRKMVANLKLRPDQIFGSQPASAAPATPEDDEFIDPAVKALRDQVGGIQTVLQQAFEQQQQQILTGLEQEVGGFETATDESGNPKYPHFAAAFDTMLQIIKLHPEIAAMPATRAREKLEKAYELAIYANPEIRQQMLESEFNRRLSERDAQSAAAKAKIAGTRKGSPGANGSAVPNGKMSLDDAVRRGWASATSR